jgi:hypothetical protein
VTLDPGVKGGLRLFEQNHVAIAGFLGRAQCKIARYSVKGRGNGDQHLVRIERRLRILRVPRVAKMSQIAARSLDWGDFRYALGSVGRQNGGGAIHSGMAEPGFRRSDQPASVLESLFLREHAADRRIAFEKQEGRQQRFFALLSRIHQLRDRENFNRFSPRTRERAVGGSQIDADDFRGHAAPEFGMNAGKVASLRDKLDNRC